MAGVAVERDAELSPRLRLATVPYAAFAQHAGDAATRIQDLYLDGKKQEATAAVPDELVDGVALVGPADRIRDRLGAWKDAAKKGHVGTLMVGTGQPEALTKSPTPAPTSQKVHSVN